MSFVLPPAGLASDLRWPKTCAEVGMLRSAYLKGSFVTTLRECLFPDRWKSKDAANFARFLAALKCALRVHFASFLTWKGSLLVAACCLSETGTLLTKHGHLLAKQKFHVKWKWVCASNPANPEISHSPARCTRHYLRSGCSHGALLRKAQQIMLTDRLR